jgi:hypothetical protein
MLQLTKRNCDSSDPGGRSDPLDNEIARDFEQDVTNEKDEERNVVFRRFRVHVQTFFESLNASIADIDAIEEGEQVYEG